MTDEESDESDTSTDDESDNSPTPVLTNRRKILGAIGVGGLLGSYGISQYGGDDADIDPNVEPPSAQGPDAPPNPDLSEAEENVPVVNGRYKISLRETYFRVGHPLYFGSDDIITRCALSPGYTFSPEGEYIPHHYDLSTDGGLVWTFDIRQNLFPDGYDQITASDYLYLIQEVHKSDWAETEKSTVLSDEVTFTETGKFQFQAELQSPDMLYPESYRAFFTPIPQELMEPYVNERNAQGLKDDTELRELSFSGNMGPYDLVQTKYDGWESDEVRDRGLYFGYTRRDDFFLTEFADTLGDEYRNAPYFEGVDIRSLRSPAARLNGLKNGTFDSAPIRSQAESIDTQQTNSDVNVNISPQPYNVIISWNMRDNGWNAGPGNLFRHKKVRQGLSAAVDTEQLISDVYGGFAKQHHTWQSRFSQFYPDDENLKKFGESDLHGSEVARNLIKEGIEQSEFDYQYDGDALVTPDGNQVELQIFHSAGQATERDQASFLAQEYEENAGIVVNVEAIEGTRYANEYWTSSPAEAGITDTVRGEEVTWSNPSPNNPGPRSEHADENWDMSMVYELNTYPLNPVRSRLFFDGANAPYNPVGYYPSTDLRPLWDDAANSTSKSELKTVMKNIYRRITDDQPYGMLVRPDEVIGYSSDINGPTESYRNGYDFVTWFADE